MNINNFKHHISKKILDRGYDYYSDGRVVDVYRRGDGEYIFQVEGNEDYEVVVMTDSEGEIVYSECDCPYDFGPICKHQVAAYFELSEILSGEGNKSGLVEEVEMRPKIEELLGNLSKEELINIILDEVQKDMTLKNTLIARYSEGDNTQKLERYKRLIKSIERKYTDREGFITYGEVHGFINEIGDLLENARNTDDILLAVNIALLVLRQVVETFQCTYESGGEIGFLASETIDCIEEMIEDKEDLDVELREKIFDMLLEQSDSEFFDEWEEYKFDIIGLCVEFADVEELRNKLRKKIECIVSGDCKYSNERLLQILFEVIDEYGAEGEAEKFLNKNLKYPSFRELMIDKLVKEKNYYKAMEVAAEGERQDYEYPGLALKWKKIRYGICKKLSLKEEQEKLARELLFDGEFEYYKDLKELNTGDAMAFYNKLKQELKEDKGWHGRSIYLKLISKEKDVDEIMEFVRENPMRVEEYAGMLQAKFKDEVVEIYKRRIKAAASVSSHRRDYRAVCEIIKRYERIAGRRSQRDIINELRETYRRRPAFVDELGKIRCFEKS